MTKPVYRNGYKILTEYEKINPFNCPVDEQTADGEYVGACAFYLKDGITCPRHGVVKDKKEFGTPYSTLEARMVADKKGLNQYFKDIILWLCDCIDNMERKIVPLKNIPEPPLSPPNRLIREGDGIASELCPECGSSMKYKLGIRTKHCVQPQCKNYYGKYK
jgi:hypothetical protein